MPPQQHGLVPFGSPPERQGTQLYRAWEKLAYLIVQMEDYGYTAHRGRSTVAFTCVHGKPHQITISRTLKAFRDGEWDGVTREARGHHPQH